MEGRAKTAGRIETMLKCTRHINWMAAGLSLAAAGSSPALEPSDVLVYRRDPLTLRPHVALTETYNDNIFSRPEGEEDFITTFAPGLNLQLGREEGNFVAFDYTFFQHFYAKLDELNAGEHSFDLRSRFRGERLAVTGSDRIQLLSNPIGLVQVVSSGPETPPPIIGGEGTGGPSQGGGTAPDPNGPGESPTSPVRGGEIITTIEARNVDRVVYSDNYNLGYAISEKTSVYLQGAHSTTDYESGVGLYDINTLRGTAGFGFQTFEKLGFFGEVYYGQTATTPNFPAPKNPHVEFMGGSLGARGKFTEKLSGSVKVGYEDRKFSDDSPAPSAPVVDVALSHHVREKTLIALNYSRLHDVSVQFARESYTADIVRLQLHQLLGGSGRWRAMIGGSYGNYEYEAGTGSPDRAYVLYSGSAGLTYQIQEWLAASFSYSYDRIDSDSVGIFDYDINRITLGVAVGY